MPTRQHSSLPNNLEIKSQTFSKMLQVPTSPSCVRANAQWGARIPLKWIYIFTRESRGAMYVCKCSDCEEDPHPPANLFFFFSSKFSIQKEGRKKKPNKLTKIVIIQPSESCHFIVQKSRPIFLSIRIYSFLFMFPNWSQSPKVEYYVFAVKIDRAYIIQKMPSPAKGKCWWTWASESIQHGRAYSSDHLHLDLEIKLVC